MPLLAVNFRTSCHPAGGGRSTGSFTSAQASLSSSSSMKTALQRVPCNNASHVPTHQASWFLQGTDGLSDVCKRRNWKAAASQPPATPFPGENGRHRQRAWSMVSRRRFALPTPRYATGSPAPMPRTARPTSSPTGSERRDACLCPSLLRHAIARAVIVSVSRFDITRRAPAPHRHEESANQQMNDPHVVALNYRIEHASWVDWSTAKPLVLHEGVFSVRVEDMRVRFLMKEHHATEDDARAAVEDYFVPGNSMPRSSMVRGHSSCASFAPRSRTGIDTGCRTHSGKPYHGYGRVRRSSGNRVAVFISGTAIDGPQERSGCRKDVLSLCQVRDRREPLTSMAYFCLNILEESAGDRSKAAKRYGIRMCVLDQLGNLSSNRGGPEARKAAGVHQNLTGQEASSWKQPSRRSSEGRPSMHTTRPHLSGS